MVKPKLYGKKMSPPVRSCLLTAAEIGLDIEFIDMDLMNKEHLSQEYLKKNPQHTIPTLEDDGKFIWDSHAIIAYLVGKYAENDKLYPKDLYKRALIDQRLHFDSGILFPKLRESVIGIVMKKERSNIPQNVIDAINEGYDFLEKFLEDNQYMIGNEMTIADLSLIATISTLKGLIPLSTDKHLKLISWIKRMESLPYYKEANSEGAQSLIDFVKKTMGELKALNL